MDIWRALSPGINYSLMLRDIGHHGRTLVVTWLVELK